MAIEVRIPTILRTYTGGEKAVTGDGASLSALIDDLKTLIERLVPERGGYRHDDPRYSDCERGNACAHLRAALLGRSIAVGLNNGELSLGRFQSVIFAELDGPRKREITVQVMGE